MYFADSLKTLAPTIIKSALFTRFLQQMIPMVQTVSRTEAFLTIWDQKLSLATDTRPDQTGDSESSFTSQSCTAVRVLGLPERFYA